MRRYRVPVIVVALLLAFITLVALLSGGARWATNSRSKASISVILYGESTERWASLSLGIRQASAELNLQAPIVSLADTHNPERQKALIERELAGGADGLIVAACDSDEMEDYFTELAQRTKLQLVETGTDSHQRVGADDAAMGAALAGGVVGGEKEVAVLATSLHRESVRRRYDAFLQAAEAAGITVVVWEPAEGETEAFLADKLAQTPAVAVVALDTETLEQAIDAAQAAQAKPRLYGIGCSDKVVYHIDRGLVVEVCLQNEFNVGYIGLLELAGQLKLATPSVNREIDYVLVNRSNAYTQQNERIIFPIIQ